MDESGISTVPNKTPMVISHVGKKDVCKVSSGERSNTASVVCCFSPMGVYVPPAMIFPRNILNNELFSDALIIFFFLVAPTLGSLLLLLEHRAEFPQFLDQGQSVGLLGQVISSSQGLYLYIKIEKRTHIHKH
jgi:hypothetical protein